ncbi:cyclic AMP-responsive element-binding protein 5 [Crotalus adamanteus]|uniref:Cyclic AMP-responsive element-binding protein 5 n=1 Tax=Crotalus adamanteus TaxID=8729 RepID=A0AAW1B2F0_CROAD
MFCTSAGNSDPVMSMRPVPGSLSSLLHLHNRQRQPMPASMPGTLPNPTMPGSSAVLMPMERQMSMNSNIMGMQSPNLSNPCASPQVAPMHSEAKMRLKAALTHIPAGISNGNMNTTNQPTIICTHIHINTRPFHPIIRTPISISTQYTILILITSTSTIILIHIFRHTQHIIRLRHIRHCIQMAKHR